MNKTTTRHMTPSWDLYKPSISLVREHYLGVMYLFFLPSLVAVLGSTLFGNPEFNNSELNLTTQQAYGVVLLLVSSLWQLVNIGPLTLFQLRVADKKASNSISQYYKDGLRFSPRLFLYYIVFIFLLIGGLLLFIVPGLIVLRRYFLAPYYLVDRNLTVRAALKQSAEASKPYRKAIWGVIGVTVAIVIFASLVQTALPLVGIVIGELIACTYLFLSVLRYREIEPKSAPTKTA